MKPTTPGMHADDGTRSSTGRRVLVAAVIVVALALEAREATAGGWTNFGPPVLFGSPEKVAGLTQRERAAFEAATANDAEGVKDFLRHDGDPRVRNAANESLLQVAARAGSWTVVDALLSFPRWITTETIREALDSAAQGAAEGRDTSRATAALRRLAAP